jgi:hypothetical protein
VCFGHICFVSDTTSSTHNTEDGKDDEPKSIVKKEGGSANRGTVYYFYENRLNVGLPELRFIDTTRSLFHRYEPCKKNNYFRTNRGNVGLVTEDLEYFYSDNILFSYGKSPFELYRYTPFNTKFYQNINPYVEMFYVMGKEREQDFRVLFTQNVLQGLNVGAEYNVINSPGVYNRTYTRHNNIRVFSNFISKDQHYRAVAGYYFNKFEANESGGISIPYDSLKFAPDNPNFISVKLQRAENVWKENSFYLKQSYHLGINRKERKAKVSMGENETKNENENENENEGENEHEKDSIPNLNLDLNSRVSRNFGYLSHALEVTRYSTVFGDKQLDVRNYPAIYKDSARTFDSTFVDLIRNTVSWNIGDVTSFQSSQFLNLSVGAISDLAKVQTDRFFGDDYSYLYPFAKLRLNYQNRYFLTAGATFQMDLYSSENKPLAASANVGLNYGFDKMKPNETVFAEVNFSDVQPRSFQEFYIGNSYRWDNSFENTQTLNLAVGARWKGFLLKSEITTFQNYIYLTSTHFEQAETSFSVFKTTLEKTFKFLSILAFDTRLVYQQCPADAPMQLPKFSTRSALYFDFDLLQTTPVQVGVEAYYNTPYYSRFYNPALGSFYNQKQLETGGFAYVDVFLNLRVQRANLFLKFTNAGAGFLGYNYMMTNGYPVVERALKFGVLWRFYD